MKENMPGSCKNGRQTDGYIDRGPRVTRITTTMPRSGKRVTYDTFDGVSQRGRFMQDIRRTGHELIYGGGYSTKYRGPEKSEEQYAADPYGHPLSARRKYTEALREFFNGAIDKIDPGRQDLETIRWHLNSIMKGQSEREAAKELDVSQPAIHKQRVKAIEKLRAVKGGSNQALADELVFFLKSEGGVALAGRLPDRVLAESTKWKGTE